MWKCDSCGEILDDFEFKKIYSQVGELYSDGEIEYECPTCGGDEFTEVERCKGCGEYISLEQAEYDKACPNCVENVKKQFAEFFGKLAPWKQDVLEELADGEYLKNII